MKKILAILSVSILFFACDHKSNVPDVSGIHIDLQVQRFEKDLFSIDTNNVLKSLPLLEQKYTSFIPVFFGGVLGLPDSSEVLEKETRRFVSVNRFVYEAAEKKYNNVNDIKNELQKSFQFVKYYFPSYAVPKIITLIGP